MKKYEMKEIKYKILYLVPVPTFKKLRFRFGSGSTSQKVTVPVTQHCALYCTVKGRENIRTSGRSLQGNVLCGRFKTGR